MRLRTRFCIFLAAGSLAGCTLGPDYAPPQPPQGAHAPFVSAVSAATTNAPTPDAWWRLYNDPALDDLIVEAFAANADLKAAEANLSAAYAVVEGARNGFYPQTTIEAAGVYGRDPVTNEILEIDHHQPFSQWVFDSLGRVSYEIDLFGRVRRSVEQAEDSAEAEAATRDAVRVTVAAETARAYADICVLGEQIDVAERSLALVTREQNITLQRHAAGANSEFDVVRAEELVAQVRSTIPPLEGQRRAALFELAALLGRTPSNAPTKVGTCVTPPRLTALMPVGDGAALLRRRPDVRRADRVLAASLAQIGIATADLYPRVSLTGFYGGVSDRIETLGTEPALAWGVGPSISWTFPNLAGPLARIQQARAGARAALAEFDGVVLESLKETEEALATYTAELDHHTALLAAQDRARRAYELASNSFRAGALSSLDLLTSEQTVVSADEAIAASDAAIVQDQIAVFKALGGGWQDSRDCTSHC